MNDNSSTNEAQNKLLSEDQMDFLLRDFFRLEVPMELNQPLQFRPTTATTLTLAAEPEHQPTRPRSVRFVAVVASVAAMAMAVVVAISAGTSPPSDGSTIANGLLNPQSATPNIDQPMLVSPNGDSQKSRHAVGADGVTLEETENIELHPQK
jgi:hypothetical protein